MMKNQWIFQNVVTRCLPDDEGTPRECAGDPMGHDHGVIRLFITRYKQVVCAVSGLLISRKSPNPPVMGERGHAQC